jgi:NAD(P)-dependent dehydrogenase (short-subunit alcohol dehydrogenase family)
MPDDDHRACEGRVALITGASKGGTGTAIALRLAAEGAAVAITARSEDGLAVTRDRIEAAGGTCVMRPVDLADPEGGRRDLVAWAEDQLGPVDILVNNAAVGGYQPFETVTAEALERSLQVNLWAPWELMAAAIDGMRARARGAILNLTTFAAELPPGPPFPTNKPSREGAVYGAPKAALNRLTVSVAAECAGQGIAVNALAPQAAIATPALVEAGWVDETMFEPLETMAEAALALCTGDPEQLTGRIAFSLQLLAELGRPVRDLVGNVLVEGWQPADLAAVIAAQEASLAERGWPDAYTFGRGHSPRP